MSVNDIFNLKTLLTMKNTLYSPLCQRFKDFLDINKSIFAFLLFSSLLLTGNLAHAQLPLFDNFESGWGNWNDGGNDCNRPNTTILNGNRVARLRDNTAGSDMFTDAINLTSYSSVTIDFIYRTQGLNNSNHDFQVQYNDGSGYVNISDLDFTVDFASNNTTYSESVTITSVSHNFVSNASFRIVSDFANDNDIVYIDDINISGVSPPCAEPTNQPTSLTFDNVLHTSIDISFTSATSSPDGYLVLYNTTGTTPTVSDGTTYTIGSTFSGNTVLSNNGDTSFSLTGLASNTTYYFYIFSSNSSCTGGPDYLNTSPLIGNETTELYCIPFGSNTSSYINDFSTTDAVNNISNTGTGFSTDGYGDFTSNFASQPAGSDIGFSANFSGGTFGLGIWVDYNNDGDFTDSGEEAYISGFYGDPISDTFTIPAATPTGSYRMRILADYWDSTPEPCVLSFDRGEAEDYTLTVLATPPCSEPANQPTSLTSSNVFDTSMDFSFAAATSSPDNYLVLYNTTGITPTIVDGTTYTLGSIFSGNTVLNNNSDTSFSLTGLSANTTYYIYVFSFNSACIGGPDYLNTSPLNGNETTQLYCIPTSTNSSRYIDDFSTTGGVTNITNNSTGYSSSGYGNFTNLSASYYPGSVLDFNANFNGNHGFAIWVDFNDDGDFFDTGEDVYNSNGSVSDPTIDSFTIPAAAPIGDHRMRILADRNSSSPNSPCAFAGNTGEAEDYTLTIIAPPPCLQPTNQPTNLIFSNVDNSSLEGNFTAATSSPDSYLVIYSTSSTPPTINDTTTYTIGSSFSGYTVADNDSDTTFTLTGLTSLTTYYFYIYSYNEACVGGPDYLITSPLTGDETTEFYCIPSSTNSSRYINDFSTTGGINNISNLSSGFSTDGYGNFTSDFATQTAGLSLDFTADFNGGTFGFGIWVDYNNDGDFTDSGEEAYISGFYDDPLNATFTIPYATASGSYRMRIVADWIDSTPGPCSIGGSGGEAEDYTLTVVAACTPSTALGTSDLGCPFIELGGVGLGSTAPPAAQCSFSETTIEATYLELGDTSSYSVESVPYSPPYQFSCLANPVSVNLDDVWSDEISLPFNFCFYDNTYDSIVISSNGVISFDPSLATGPAGWRTTRDIPNAVNASNGGGTGYYFGPSIYGVHHDVDPSVGGQIGYQLITLDSGCQALVAAWSDVPMFYDNSILYSGMIVFYENTNIIEVYVKEKNIDGTGSGTFGSAPWNEGNASIGLQGDSTTGTVAPGRNTLDTNWTVTEEAWRFVPNGASITDLKWYENSISAANEIIDPNDDNQIEVTPSNTTTYFAEITYTLCDGSTIVETNDTTVTIEGRKTWNGSNSTDWNDSDNWTPTGVPVSTDCITIPITSNDPIMSVATNGVGYNLEIEDGALLTQQSNATLTIEDAITIEPNGDLEVRDSASIIQITDVTTNKNAGSAKVQRKVDGINNYDYVYWSSPVNVFDVQDISPGTSNSGIYNWVPTIANGTAGQHGTWINTTENMELGKGYIVRGLIGNSITNTAEFNGTLNNGKISYPISRGTYSGTDYVGIGNTATAEDDNWNLLGNPYPSAIALKDFVLANPAIDGTLYFWQHLTPATSGNDNPFYEGYVYNYSSNDYLAANSLGSSPPGFNGFIASGQGFFALMLDSAPVSTTVSYDNTMRGVYVNNGFYRSTSNTIDEKHRIWIDLVNEDNVALSTLIGFANGATNGIDRLYDGFLNSQSEDQFYSIVSEQKLTIQGKALPFENSETVPLGYKASSLGSYTVSINQLDGLFSNLDQGIYIEDTALNIIHDLRANPYVFTTDSGTFDDRFILRFNNQILSIKDQDILSDLNIRAIDKTIEAMSKISTIKTFELFDITGRAIHKNLNVENVNYSYNTNNLSNGTYIVTVSLANGTKVSKKLMI